MRTIVYLALFSVISLNARGQEKGQELEAKLRASVSQYSLSANGLVDALARTAKQFQLPMGIESVKDKDAVRSLTRTWKGDTVGAILRSIVKDYPGYAVRIEHGVVYVFRRDLVNDNRNFLNLKVPEFFEARHEISGLTNQRLRSVMQNIVSPRNLPPGAGEGGSYATGIEERPLNLMLRGATVREALGKLAEASQHKMWVVTFSDSPALTPTGFRRTETLWHPTPFPDSEQPMWDFLAWQEYVPESIATPSASPR